MVVTRYQDLEVWQHAHRWVLGAYQVSGQFPPNERFGLTSQLRRAAVSVPSNIVEGFRRRGLPEKIRFYNIAQASLDEAEYQLLLAHDLGYANTISHRNNAQPIARMLTCLIRAVEQRLHK